jgi:hypothetical protein
MVEYIPCYGALAEHWGLLPATRLASRKILIEQNIKKRTGPALCVFSLLGPRTVVVYIPYSRVNSVYTVPCTHNKPPPRQYSPRSAPSDIFVSYLPDSFAVVFFHAYCLDLHPFYNSLPITTRFYACKPRLFTAWFTGELWQIFWTGPFCLRSFMRLIDWLKRFFIPFSVHYTLNLLIILCRGTDGLYTINHNFLVTDCTRVFVSCYSDVILQAQGIYFYPLAVWCGPPKREIYCSHFRVPTPTKPLPPPPQVSQENPHPPEDFSSSAFMPEMTVFVRRQYESNKTVKK